MFGRVDTLTKQKTPLSVKLPCARLHGSSLYAAPGLNPNERLCLGKALKHSRASSVQVVRCVGRSVKVASACRAPLEAREGYTVQVLDLRSSARSLVSSAQRCDALVLDSPWAPDQVSALRHFLLSIYLIVVGLGLRVLPRKRWSACKPGAPPSGALVYFRPAAQEKATLKMTEGVRRKRPLLAAFFRYWRTSRAPSGAPPRRAGQPSARPPTSAPSTCEFVVTNRRDQAS